MISGVYTPFYKNNLFRAPEYCMCGHICIYSIMYIIEEMCGGAVLNTILWSKVHKFDIQVVSYYLMMHSIFLSPGCLSSSATPATSPHSGTQSGREPGYWVAPSHRGAFSIPCWKHSIYETLKVSFVRMVHNVDFLSLFWKIQINKKYENVAATYVQITCRQFYFR